jgi:poly(hydroxyalkanoate) granule-associated protein
MAETGASRSRPVAARAAAKRHQPVRRTRAATRPARTAKPSTDRNNLLGLVMSVIQAPVGLAAGQADRIVTELMRTGNLGQREAERLFGELRSTPERAHGRAQQESARLDRFIESRIEDVLNRVNIPSRSDIERLNHSVDLLTAKVEALVSRQDRGSR